MPDSDDRAARQPTALPKREIFNVQFLRGVAAMLVVASHLLLRLVKRGVYPEGAETTALGLGEIGVATFFSISGFVMVYTTFDKFGHPGAPFEFIRRRIIRILPMYYITMILIILFEMTMNRLNLKSFNSPSYIDIIRSMAFIPYLSNDNLIMPVYTLGWTLEYEMFFYSIFAICMWQKPTTGIMSAIFVISTIVIAGKLFELNLTTDPNWHNVIIYFFTRPIMMYFILGMTCAILFLLADRQIGATTFNTCICLMAPAILVFGSIADGLWRLLSVTLVMLICTILYDSIRTTWFSRFSRVFGDVSYSMYLTHSFLLGALAWFFAQLKYQGNIALLGYIAIAGLVCFVVAWCSWKFVEVPIGRKLNAAMIVKSDRRDVARH